MQWGHIPSLNPYYLASCSIHFGLKDIRPNLSMNLLMLMFYLFWVFLVANEMDELLSARDEEICDGGRDGRYIMARLLHCLSV